VDGEVSQQTGPFRPEVFFVGRTEGWGLARGPTGRTLRRCRIVTDGNIADAYRAIHFDETFHWEDGEQDLWRWAMTRGLDGRYAAAEVLAGTGIQGRYEGPDYVLSFRRPLKPEGGPRPRFVTRFTQISPAVALKSVKIYLFGLPVGGMTAFHKRVD
jgi:hypothetical protein